MKFETRVLLLTVLLIILTVSFVLFRVVFNGNADSGIRYREDFSLLSSSQVSRIRFENNVKETVLEKTSGGWRIIVDKNHTFPADKGKIERFLQSVGTITAFEEVTDQREHWSRFGVVKEQQPFTIIIEDGEGERMSAFYIGEQAAGEGEFIRFIGENMVYRIRKSLSFYAAQTVSYWSHLGIVPEDVTAETITRVSVQAQEAYLRVSGQRELPLEQFHYTLVREQSDGSMRWVLEDNPETPLDQENVEEMITRISLLQAIRFVINPDRLDSRLEGPAAFISITTVTDREYRVNIGNKMDSTGYVVSPDFLPYTYIVDGVTVEKLLQPRSALHF
jgi:hypothetical protein